MIEYEALVPWPLPDFRWPMLQLRPRIPDGSLARLVWRVRQNAYPFQRYLGFFVVLLAAKCVLRSLFATGDGCIIFKFATWWLESGLHNPWEYALQVEPALRTAPVSPFAYPPLMLFLIAVPRAVTYYLGWPSPEYSPIAALPMTLMIAALDCLSAVILVRVCQVLGWSRQRSMHVFWAWHLSLVAIYVTYLQTQYDLIPVFFSLLFVYLALRRRYFAASLCLCAGILTKSYPLVLLVVYLAMLLNDERLSPLKRTGILLQFGLLLGGMGLATYWPFLGSPAFERQVLRNGEMEHVWFLAVPLVPNWFPALYVVIAWYTFLSIYAISTDYRDRGKYLLVCYGLLLPFSTIIYPQPMWFLWAHPFFLLALLYLRRGWFAYLVLNLPYFLHYLYNQWSALTQLMMYRWYPWPLHKPLITAAAESLGPDTAVRIHNVLLSILVTAQFAVLLLALGGHRPRR